MRLRGSHDAGRSGVNIRLLLAARLRSSQVALQSSVHGWNALEGVTKLNDRSIVFRRGVANRPGSLLLRVPSGRSGALMRSQCAGPAVTDTDC